MLLYLAIFTIVLAWAYILFIREWLVRAFPHPIIIKIHILEHRLWNNSRTILVSRLYWIGGIIIMIHDFVATEIGWTPLLLQISRLIPHPYQYLFLGGMLLLTGVAFEYLRNLTRKPVEKTAKKKGG